MYKISGATHSDIGPLTKLVNTAYRGEASRAGWTTEADFFEGDRIDEAGMSAMLSHPNAVMLKYEEKQELLGCVYLRNDDGALYLGMLTVAPGSQGKGIGKVLLQASEDVAGKQHCNKIYMRVIHNRTELISWYLRHGYTDTGERMPYAGDNHSVAKQEIVFAILEKRVF